MKKLIFTFFLAAVTIFAVAQTNLNDYLKNEKEAYVKVSVNSEKEIAALNRGISVEILDDQHVAVYITKANLDFFNSFNFKYEILTNPSKLYNYQMYSGGKDTYEWDTYPTYDSYISIMEQFALDYPEICQTFSIGQSVEGRELMFVKISDNVGVDEQEPQFLYTGTIHGDETTGYVTLLHLIDYLLSNYGTDAEVTEMVDNLEIWINPASNPDGTYAGGNNTVWGATRNNANGVNLNRNYPDPSAGPHPDGNAWQPETIAFMALAEDNHFVISANTHGGAEVVNYPWDTWSQLAADDDWWQFVSHEFADTAQANSPSTYMNGFDDGITNGYAWYSIDGGRQDYMNYYYHCREVTLEISDIKTIPENQLLNHWNYLSRSFINYMKQTLYGVQGVIIDCVTDEPIGDVEVEIIGHDFDESQVYSTSAFGDYYRYLNEGTYDITFTKEGYLPVTIENVEVVNYQKTILNVELCSASLVADFSADVTDVALGGQVQFAEECYGDIDSYHWTFEGGTPATSTEANPTVTYNETGSFDVSLTIFSGSDSQTITKEDFIRVSEQYIMENGETTTCSGLFIDNGGIDGDYGNNLDLTYTIYGDALPTEAVLSIEFLDFNVEYQSSCDYDYLEIYNGANTASELIGTYCGTNSPGTVVADNDDNALTFKFHSDGSVTAAGWRAAINCTIVDQINEIAKKHYQVFPNPALGHVQVSSDDQIRLVELFNMAGQSIRIWVVDSYSKDLNIDGIEKGIYMMQISTVRGSYTEKLSIN